MIMKSRSIVDFFNFQQVTSEQLNDSLKSVFEAFKLRSEYLDCLKDPTMRLSSGSMQGPPAVGKLYLSLFIE